ncbi:type IV secretory system conjugative DNA transfer family protein [Deinococcus marmoris]|uniref:Coupling protein VirD4, ATPase required for T-DNA transfer n=1 Tax=Deinococcus marmoris TaxID=249408 RepID=A0A1U7NXB0_9DEIO|nr:type IV secretory system conjugative DNA transfer family protein [Deinococcus marmoris]OLV17565.1 Coupling protein VirD4, ATPase required for T-DNA transfer [Deinococcus marmoris]
MSWLDLITAGLLATGIQLLRAGWGRPQLALANAGFASPDETRDLRVRLQDPNTGQRLLIATAPDGRHLGLRAPPELGHMLIVGPSRSGKGLHLIANLLDWRGSAIVTDLKGEFYRTTAGWRSSFGRVVVLDPRGNGTPYDPINHLATSEQGLSAAATILLTPEKDGNNSIFASAAVPILVAMFRAAHVLGQPTFGFVAECVRGRGMQGTVELLRTIDDAVVQDNVTLYLGRSAETADDKAPAAGTNPDDARSLARQAWSTLTTRLQPMLVDGVLRMTDTAGARPLAPQDLWAGPTTVYLRCPEDLAPTLGPLLRLITWTLIQARIAAADAQPETPLIPLLLGLDETGVLPVPGLPDTLATVAGRGISALIYVQALSQLNAVYGVHGADALMANCLTQIFYPTSAPETQRHVSLLAGSTALEQRSRSTSRPVGLASRRGTTETQSATPREQPLIGPGELRRMHGDNVVVIDRARPAIVAARLRWFSEPLFKARAKLSAPPVKAIRTGGPLCAPLRKEPESAPQAPTPAGFVYFSPEDD